MQRQQSQLFVMKMHHPIKNLELVKPLKWLIGRWNSIKAVVSYPTMCPLNYGEVLCFTWNGQPLLCYSSKTFQLKDKSPIHLESGFVRIDVNKNVSLLTAQNFGITTVEEGKAGDQFLFVKSKVLGNTKFIKTEVCALTRCYKLNEHGQLIYSLKMQTKDVALTDHCYALYERDKNFQNELD